MEGGYVYVLANPLTPNCVKIGRTKHSPEDRAAELSRGTGVALPYLVIDKEFVTDVEAVEKRLHTKFAAQRINPNREFFKVPYRDAYRALREVAAEFGVLDDERHQAVDVCGVEMLPQLRAKFGDYIRPEISSAVLYHRQGACFLQVKCLAHQKLKDERIDRVNLWVIGGGEEFAVAQSPEENVEKFVTQMDAVTIAMCTPLFRDDAARRICESEGLA
jgi:hypothetical protein